MPVARSISWRPAAASGNRPEAGGRRRGHGSQSAQEEIWPQIRQQRCRMHKTSNVLNGLPRSVQPKVRQADTGANAEKAFDPFIGIHGDGYPMAAMCLEKDRGELMTFHDFPAAHRRSCRTANPTESTFATGYRQIANRYIEPVAIDALAVGGLPDPPWHAAHDLQSGSVCPGKMEPDARAQKVGEGHDRSEIQGSYRGHRDREARS